jgi:hypothetical protein
LSKLLKHSFLEKTINISFPEVWKVEHKDYNMAEVKFPFGPYPVLGCYFKCFDGPKITSDEKIKSYMLEGVDSNISIEKLDNNTFILKTEFKAQEENLILWKILHFLKPRSFREVRFSMAWPNQNEANALIDKILDLMPEVINNIEFNNQKTIYDQSATIQYKLQKIKLKKHFLWSALNINIPEKWSLNIDKVDKLANIEIIDKSSFNFFCEYFDITKKANNENNDAIVTKFIEDITKDVVISNERFIKSNNNYIFSFYSEEKVNDIQTINHMWYRFSLRPTKILIASFVFNYINEEQIIGRVYKEKIDSLIKNCELI